MNCIGVDVTHLDLDVFRELSRLVYLGVYVGWCVWLWRTKRWVGIFVPVLLALVFWAMTTYPLERNYGLGRGTDRQRNLGWCATAAAGNAVWESGLNGGAHLEPFWVGLVSFLALRDPENVRRIYPFLTAFSILAVGLSFWFAFRRQHEGDEEEDHSGGAATLVLFFVLVASTQTLDFMKSELGWIGKYMMLKPNHTFAFAFVPLGLWVLSKPLTWTRSILAGLILTALGWGFVIFWLLFCWGVCLYVAARAITRNVGRHELSMTAILLAQLVLVAPYLYYLRVNFPQAAGLSAGKQLPEDPNRSPWGEAPPRDNSLLLSVTMNLGASFYLALYGAWVCYRRATRLNHLWLALAAGAYLGWIVNGVLYTLARARGSTHLHVFLILIVAVLAGIGAYDLIQRCSRLVRHPALSDPVRLTAIGLLCWMPMTLGWWWTPESMDGHFRIAREPIAPEIETLSEWILTNTAPDDILCADSGVIGWIPALTGRRAYRPRPPRRGVPFTDECSALVHPVAEVTPVGAKFLVSDATLRERGVEGFLDEHPGLERIFRAGELDVYRLVASQAR